jgi:hypothetical protein
VPVWLTVRNTASVSGRDVLMSYRVPAGFRVVSTSRRFTRAGAVLTFRWGAMHRGQSARVRVVLVARTATRLRLEQAWATTSCTPSPVTARAQIQAQVRTGR